MVLADGAEQGVYTSPEIETEPFDYMILSWNATTPEGSYIEIAGRVRVAGRWSRWLPWGSWATSDFVNAAGQLVKPGSAPKDEREDDLVAVEPDELRVKGSPEDTATAFQYRLVLHRAPGGSGQDGCDHAEGERSAAVGACGGSPSVSLVACSIKNSIPGQAIPKVWEAAAGVGTAGDGGHSRFIYLDKDLDVQQYSQYQQDPKIAHSICSPTSMAMAMTYHGVPTLPEEAAWAVRDNTVPMFGNWPFNTAFVGSRGFRSYVDYLVPAEGADPWGSVKQEIAAGRPVVISVRYRKPGYEDGKYKEPEVEGVPINRTPGHLVLVRGFTWKDGVEYVIVNDSAGATNEEVRRLYRADQFFRAWVKNVAYLVIPPAP
ncbi:MAG: C39 family peptidase [Bacillota bacterium]